MAIVAVLLPVLALIPPLSVFQPQPVWVDGFSNAGVFVLLALGLNIVVGMAGLLDLGYAAFFAIGAYTYAYGASPFSGLHAPFWPMLLVGALDRGDVRRPARRADPPPPRRLPRDRDPRLRRDRPDRLPERRQVHRGHERDRRASTSPSLPGVEFDLAEPVAVLPH